jgi:tRNA (cytidine32/uridine32-2'-O)-methyltransferase
MKCNSIRIVLVSTSHPGNIGSTARAMKTMGLGRLYLVSPRSFPDRNAFELAAGADDVLDGAIVTHTLAEALVGCHLVLGTSARPRGIELPGVTPEQSAALAHDISDSSEVAFVFGRELSGLSNDELLHCHYHVTIPSHPDFSSLNLAQAVQIIAYELRKKFLSGEDTPATISDELATADQVERFYEHLQTVLVAIDFLKLSNPIKLVQRLRRLFNRVKLEATEVNILRGILSNIQRALQRRGAHDEP